jgi:hypothetical protein
MEKSSQLYAPAVLIPGEKAFHLYSRGDCVKTKGELIMLHDELF